MTLEEKVLIVLRTLSLDRQREMLDFAEFLKNRDETSHNEPSVSFLDAAKNIIGCLEGGQSDLSSNKNYMEGFGTMMRKRVLLDTGPLVALLKKQDKFHEWAVREAGAIVVVLYGGGKDRQEEDIKSAKHTGRSIKSVRKLRTLDELEADYFRKRPDEIGLYLTEIFEEYAADGDSAALLASLRVIAQVKGITVLTKTANQRI